MRLLSVPIVLALAVLAAADAQAQMGLYGSPEPLPLQQMQGSGGQAAPAVYTPGASPPALYQTAAQAPADLHIPQPPSNPAGANLAPVPMPPPPAYQPQAAGSPSPVTQMLAEPTPAPMGAGYEGTISSGPAPVVSGPGCAGGGCNGGSGCGGSGGPASCDYGDGMPRGGCLGRAIGCGDCGDGCCMPWYGSARALYMTRDKPNMLYTTAQTNAPENQWGDNRFDWQWGAELTLGRHFGCCNEWSIEGTYWALSEFNRTACATDSMSGPFNTPFTMGLVNGPGTEMASDWFDNSPQHEIHRINEIQNLEFNLLRNNLCGGECSNYSIDMLMGVRYFRFRDRLIFSAQHGQFPLDGGGNPSPYCGDWIDLNDQVTNSLVGFQFGFNAEYRLACCLKAFVTPKFGIYNNHMELKYNLSSRSGLQASSPTYQSCGIDYPVCASTDGFSLLSQVDVGLDWQFSQHCGAQIGYRVMGATGMGLADNQVPAFGNDTLNIANIDKNGSLILHGAFVGLTFCF